MSPRDDYTDNEQPESGSVPNYLKDPVAFIQHCRDQAARRDREGVPLVVISPLEPEPSAQGEQEVIPPPSPAPLPDAGSAPKLRQKIDRWHWPIQMAAQPPQPSLKPGGYEIIAPYNSSAEDAVTAGTRTVELRRSRNRIWTVRVQLTGAAAKGRLARFTIESPPGGEPWNIVCFVGTDENGIGELSLSRFDPRRQWKLAPGCTFTLEPLVLQDLQPDDRIVLEKSRDAALAGRAALDAILAGMPKSTSAE